MHPSRHTSTAICKTRHCSCHVRGKVRPPAHRLRPDAGSQGSGVPCISSSSFKIPSCILPRKFYLCSPLLLGGITSPDHLSSTLSEGQDPCRDARWQWHQGRLFLGLDPGDCDGLSPMRGIAPQISTSAASAKLQARFDLAICKGWVPSSPLRWRPAILPGYLGCWQHEPASEAGLSRLEICALKA